MSPSDPDDEVDIRRRGLRGLIADPPLIERFTWREGIQPQTLISQDSGLIARTFGSLYFVGGTLGLFMLIVGDANGSCLPSTRPSLSIFAVDLLIVSIATLGTTGMIVGLLLARVEGIASGFAAEAHTDPVTAIGNRRDFNTRFKLELERAERHGRSVSLVRLRPRPLQSRQ